jgi:hypothetical protein
MLYAWPALTDVQNTAVRYPALHVFLFALDHDAGDLLPYAGYHTLCNAESLQDIADFDISKGALKKLLQG